MGRPKKIQVEIPEPKPLPITVGNYVLTQDVINPQKDGRYRNDWRYLDKIEKGTQFVVTSYKESYSDEAIKALQAVGTYKTEYEVFSMQPIHSRYEKIGYGYVELWNAIVPHLTQIEENFEAVWKRLDFYSNEFKPFMKFLIEKKGWTFQELENIYKEFQEFEYRSEEELNNNNI